MNEKDKYKGFPIKIETNEILEPKTRWICQRLDRAIKNMENLYRELAELRIEVRDINSRAEDIRDAINDFMAVNRDGQRVTEEGFED